MHAIAAVRLVALGELFTLILGPQLCLTSPQLSLSSSPLSFSASLPTSSPRRTILRLGSAPPAGSATRSSSPSSRSSSPSQCESHTRSCVRSLLIGYCSAAIDQLRNGAITSIVVVELAWTAILGIFWLAAAAAQASNVFIPGDCSIVGGEGESICRQFQAMQAFSWLNWIILWGWTFLLVVVAAIALSRGNRGVWTAPAGQTDFFARGEGSSIPPVQQQSTGATYNPTYPPQQQAFVQPGVQPQYTGQPAV
ncbi:hypothetical protein AURDEDRAFT_52382 [Auricularia subglabra TFB-10046 SS5]|nr:hypothetical protein AURDEDRAFT_52382 [Auricularia subglabra TFB-10046 SS5]